MVETGFRRVIITVTVILCSLLELIDTSIVNVAITDIMGNLGATLGEVSWVIASYAIANVIVVPMTSFLAAQFGRRNYYVMSVVIFTIASVLCGNSSSIWELVFFRFIQGLGGGGLIATSQSILFETYPKEKAGMAGALFGMGVLVGPTLGPTLGGVIVDSFSWPWIFYINLPVGIIASILALIFIRNENYGGKVQTSDIDWLGIILLIIGVGSLQLVLEQGEREDWFETTYIAVFTFVSIIGIILFLWRESVAKHPVIDISIFSRSTSLSIGTLLSFVLGFGLFASVFIYPVFVQRFLGFTATQTGLSLLPGALMSALCMPIVGILLQKGVQQKYIIPVGFFIFFMFTYLTYSVISPVSGENDFYYPLLLRGIGMSFIFVPLSTYSLSGLEGRDMAQGSGITSMMRQLGGSFSVAIVSTFIERQAQIHKSHLVENFNIYNSAFTDRINLLTQGFLSKGMSLEIAKQQALKVVELQLFKQSMLATYTETFLIIGVGFLICIPFILLIKQPKTKTKIDMNAGH